MVHIKSTAANQPVVKIENEQGGSNPLILELTRNSSTPDDSDSIAQIEFRGENDNDEETLYAYMIANSIDVSDGSEDGEIQFHTMKAGTITNTLTLESDSA